MFKMNMSKTAVFAVSALMLLSTACSKRAILVSANASLDPFPAAAAPAAPAVAGAAPVTGDPLAKNQWALNKLEMSKVWARGLTGSKRVVVAVLGTGVDYTHEDLRANVLVNAGEWKELTPGAKDARNGLDDDGNGVKDDFVGYDFVEDDGFPFDRHGMGTAMAGVIAATTDNGLGIRGMMKEVSILPVRYIDSSGGFKFPHMVQALEYAAMMKADVVVMHFPSYQFGSNAGWDQKKEDLAKIEADTIRAVLKKLEKAGVPVVISAGNAGASGQDPKSLLNEFAKRPNVLVVTSVDENDQRPFIANFGMRTVHTSAPGQKVMTTIPGGYAEMSGTAIAAAHLAGALGLALSHGFGKVQAETLIQAAVKPDSGDQVSTMQFDTIGGNRLNVDKFIRTIVP